ncbi:hypothetical protein K491DRAFT_723742 [Lophiostoma macrostomum CBS 122681]|uniref:Uncharacterized protein n=1 Tax=Lophiostoma macrostomum CBS 122681 TaxID=1314788 RepID=A0A6A6SL09_9PLEO|nr:hypothetical protein K491DRAFT_723742 [Lophiostoma macrostomum CBS 122681]
MTVVETPPDPIIQHICNRLAHVHLGVYDELKVLAENTAFLIRHECGPSALEEVNSISITFIRLNINSPMETIKATVTVHQSARNFKIITQAGVQAPKTDIISELYSVVEERVRQLLG